MRYGKKDIAVVHMGILRTSKVIIVKLEQGDGVIGIYKE